MGQENPAQGAKATADTSGARRVPRYWRGWRLGLALLVPVVTVGGHWLTRDPSAHVHARHGVLASVAAGAETPVPGGLLDRTLTLVSSSGLEVELRVRRPAGAAPRPAVLLLGGHRTGRDAVDLVPDTGGVVLAALSYPTDVRRIHGPVDLLAARRAILDTPAACMLALDWLVEQPFVDAARVELVGVSLGALFSGVVGALDERFARVWSVHGGGRLLLLADEGLKREIAFAPARKAAALLAWLFLHGPVLAPEDWVPRITPRPFVMVAASDDERIPRESIESLWAAAREPKDLVWVPGGHVDADRKERVRRILELVLARIEGETAGPSPVEAGAGPASL